MRTLNLGYMSKQKQRTIVACSMAWLTGTTAALPSDRGPLFDLAAHGTAYQMVVEQGGAYLVNVGAHQALEISAPAGGSAEVRIYPPGDTFWDLRDDAFISLDIENRRSEETAFRIDTGSEYPWSVDIHRGRGALMHLGWLHGGETRQFNCFLIRHEELNEGLYDLTAFPNMRGKPHKLVLLGWFGLDVTKINQITIHLPIADFPRTVRVHQVFRYESALAEEWLADPESFFPFIDRYGQYNKADWPGKIHSDADLQTAREEEDIDLAAHPWPASFNQYGGFAAGLDYGATGHFRVQKIDGRWMFIDPDGRPFWSFGVNSTGNTGVGNVWNRRHFFEWLPDEDPETASFLSNSSYRVGELNLWRKYGDEYESIYKERALQRMRSWTLNTLGGWQRVDLGQSIPGKLPYTWTVRYTPPRLGTGIPDPYDPGFRDAIRAGLAEVPDTWEDPFCIGYFVDNELSWGMNGLFDAAFEAAGPAREAFIIGLQGTYATVDDLAAAWGISIAAFEDVASLDPVDIRALGSDDVTAFYDDFVETYFRTIREEMDAVAPNKLYLGCRWNNWNQRVIERAANHVDVFSFNLYRKEIRDHDFYGVDKPFISTEFNFGAVDRGKFFPGLGWSSDQRNRGEQAMHYIQSALDNPLCVGAHWFMWMNTVTWGRGNGENAGMGLVDDADTPYPEIRAAMRTIGSNLYAALDLEVEISPPYPTPAQWLHPPVATDPVTVVMEAVVAEGSYPPFEYHFEEVSGNLGGVNSGWQMLPVYTNHHLLPNTEYVFTVQTRDAHGRVTERSIEKSVVTPAAPPAWIISETLIEEHFDNAEAPFNSLPPFPANRWHANDARDWERDSSAGGNSLALTGSALRLGWGFDEVVARFFTEEPWSLENGYRLRGEWEIENVLELHLGAIAGFGEYAPSTGDMIQRIKSISFGETEEPLIGQTGSFSILLTPEELVSSGVQSPNYIGVFFHCDDDGTLFHRSGTGAPRNDVYLLRAIWVERLVRTQEDLLPGILMMGAIRSAEPPEGESGLQLTVPGEQVLLGRMYILEVAPTLEGPWRAMDHRVPPASGESLVLGLAADMPGKSAFFRIRTEWDFE